MKARMRRLASGLVLVALLLLVTVALVSGLVACGKQSQKAVVAPPGKPMTLKVMEFNIENGGTQISLKQVVAAIKAADPDVVGIEEAYLNTPRIAKMAGYPFFSNSMQIVSKFPLLEPATTGGAYTLVEVQPGYCVALSNVHLPSNDYGPHEIRIGWPAAKVITMENKVRVPAIQTQIKVLPALAKAGIPTFLVGDFNSPSGLDYTQAAVNSRPYRPYALDWPVSAAMLGAGIRDSFRDVYPDPVKDPGLTWPAPRPKVNGWNPDGKAPQDRIDYIYAIGPSKTVASQIVGEKGNPAVGVQVAPPWPSDHRGVMSTFTLTPAPLPVMVAVNAPLLTVGQPLIVTFHAPGISGEKVAIVVAGGDPKSAAITSQSTGAAGTIDGQLTFATERLAPGDYEAVLTAADGGAIARQPFWVQAVGAKPIVATDKSTYTKGEPIVVSWKNAPANRWDWLGVYKASAADPNVDYYLIWQYTGGAIAGTMAGPVAGTLSLDKSAQGSPWPLPPGKYVVYYLVADGYKAVAQAAFTVTK
jgi:endonuclease/exonuclease/phosphatase (EEP) superfamily protein YafD